MKQLFVLALLILSPNLFAQLNANLRSNVDYADPVNDIWGYVAPDGTEYAIVGLQTGLSFVSLADPDNAVEVVRVPGDNSIWRDMKTFGNYAYSVADQGNQGITAFDLRFLPDSVPVRRNLYEFPETPGLTFRQAHNLYIDVVKGLLFTAGGDRRIFDGGVIVFDLNGPDPLTPEYRGNVAPTYAHDVYVMGDTVYASEIYDGELEMYDISQLDSVVSLGSTLTPFDFTHNAWTTADGAFVFTTDERANAPVASYDITDQANPELIDEFRPRLTVGTGVIPHNVHVIDEYLSISYYTDGLVVADASKPDNVIEVANYDTWTGSDGGFNGAWGAFPYLPSGLTLVSDRSTGLYVIDVDYKRAARLEGSVRDREFGDAINNVRVNIATDQLNAVTTDATGTFKTGVANGGTFTVTLEAENYETLTLTLDIANGDCVRLDTFLTASAQRFDLELTVVDDATGDPLPGAIVELQRPNNDFSARTNAQGTVGFSRVFDGDYELVVTEWGYRTVAESITPGQIVDREIRLTPGYMDDFVTDEGWTISGNAPRGVWERGEPVATFFGQDASNPGFDAPDDLGRQAYVTGNGGGSAGNDDVDGGETILTSPPFGPLRIRDPRVSYQYWHFNAGGEGEPNDTLRLSITNGEETVLVREYTENTGGEWVADSFIFSEFLPVTEEMRLIVVASDNNDSGHLVEAGFDNFLVYGEEIPASTDNYFTEGLTAAVYPNPSAGAFRLDYEGITLTAPRLRITDAGGRTVAERAFAGSTVMFGEALPRGFYVAELWDGGRRLYVTKVTKQ